MKKSVTTMIAAILLSLPVQAFDGGDGIHLVLTDEGLRPVTSLSVIDSVKEVVQAKGTAKVIENSVADETKGLNEGGKALFALVASYMD